MMVIFNKIWDEAFRFISIALAICGIYFLVFSDCSPIDTDNIVESAKEEMQKQTQKVINEY